MRHSWLLPTALLILGLTSSLQASHPTATGSAQEALDRLHAGNLRFLREQPVHGHQQLSWRQFNALEGQKPFATVLACSDSRVPVEILFDQGVGDIFTIRVAGNVVGEDEAGSIEYGTGHLGSKLVVVLGHTRCGAVTAAVDGAEPHGNVTALIEKIDPAVARIASENKGASRDERLAMSIRENVVQAVRDLLGKSRDLKKAVREKTVVVVGAVYDLDSGAVHWLGTSETLGAE